MELTNKTRPEASYDVSVLPRVEGMQFIGPEDNEIQLTVLYNMPYYVSVTATTCGYRHETSNMVALYYSKYIHVCMQGQPCILSTIILLTNSTLPFLQENVSTHRFLTT